LPRNLSKTCVFITCLSLLGCTPLVTYKPIAEVVPTTRLTLLPQGSQTLVKLNGIESRALITDQDLKKPLQLFATDPTLRDFMLITPQKTSVAGVYSFPYTHVSPGYRVWADVHPLETVSKKGLREFPRADLGARKIGDVKKTNTLEAIVNGQNYTLTFDKAPLANTPSIGTIKSASVITGEVFGFYDDFSSVFRIPLDANGRFQLVAKKPAFIKLFLVITSGEKTNTVPFGVVVASKE
jgi:hypothetical protein